MDELLRIQTSITERNVRSYLFYGTSLALLGLAGLVLAGVFFPEPLLQKWGWMIYLGGVLLITLGLLPYRKLVTLQNRPNEIKITANHDFEFWSKNRCCIRFPLTLIQDSQFVKGKNFYGIKIQLKDKNFELIENLKKSDVLFSDKNGIFFTFFYFSQRAYGELKKCLETESEALDS